MKQKTCRVCKSKFNQFNSTQFVCSPGCAIKYVSQQERKDFKKETKILKEKAKKRSEWLDEAQTAFNAYVRYRDKDEPCISCGTEKPAIQYCAGHYLTRGGFPELRFSELNVHKQCNRNCNLGKSGNQAAYRINLVKRIGIKNVEWLEGPQELQKLTIEDIKEIKAHYKERLKILKKGDL